MPFPRAGPAVGLAASALVLLRLVLPEWALFTVTIALAKGLVVLGLLVLWRTGLVPFGQALYYALGAYAAGLAQSHLLVTDAAALAALGVLASSAVAAVLGVLLARYREIFFAMLSLAFSMILYGLLVKSQALGSTDGMTLAPPTLLGYAPRHDDIVAATYALASAAAVAAGALVHRYLGSEMGHLCEAIRDNELRVEYLGASVRRAVHLTHTIAAALAGAGGAITATAVGHVGPEMAYWTTSGEFVFVTVMSGAGSVAAPFIGAAVFEVLRTYAMAYAPHAWQMTVGASLLTVIALLPEGLSGAIARVRAGVRGYGAPQDKRAA